MKTALLTILAMTSVSSLALAADRTKDVGSEGFAVEKMICNQAYVPATGAQSPNYQAGVDVNGNAVAPADVSPIANAAPDYIEVPMTIDLAQRMGLSQVGLEGKMPVANLKLYKTGKVEYNGQDISSNAATLCGFAKKSETKPSHQVEPAAGQDAMIAAPSVTVEPDTSNYYQPDGVAPDDKTPVAGSVAASTTSSEPKVQIQIQRSTVNRAATPIQIQ